jgi:predicted dehydrogenase
MNQAIHSVDLLLWLMGPVAEVNARTATMTHQRIEVEDVAIANLLFKNGSLGVIEATTTAFPGSLKRIEICGSGGMAILEEEDLKQWTFTEETPEDEAIRARMAGKTKTGGGAGDPAAIGHHGHTMLFNEFTAAIHENRVPLIDGKEGRRSVELIQAIYESAKTGQTIKLHCV